MSSAYKNFEFAISDAQELLSCYDSLNKQRIENNSPAPPEVLKRASLIMILTSWETYVEDVATELFEAKFGMLKGSHIGEFMEQKFNEQLKVFNNPDSRKTKHLFLEFFGLDVTESWVWNGYLTPQETRTALNIWLKKRGEAVHRAQIDKQNAHIVKRDELDKCIRFFKDLVKITDETLQQV